MSSKEKDLEKLELSRKYLSGELEFLRKERIAAGGVSWRILRYQRIVNPNMLSIPISNYRYISPEIFENQIKFLVKEFKIVSLSKILSSIEKNEAIPDKSIAITIDGGWVDNFVYAYPIVKKYNVPISCFIPTSVINTDELFWEDKVMVILLHLKNNNMPLPMFEIFPENIKNAIKSNSANLEITVEIIFLFILALNTLDLKQRLTILFSLSEIFNRLNGGYPNEPTYLSWEEVRIMENSGVFFGSLGNIPNFFSDLEPAAMKIDIEQSFEILKSRINKVFPIFAFPDARVPENAFTLIKSLGHKFALGGDGVFFDSRIDIFPI